MHLTQEEWINLVGIISDLQMAVGASSARFKASERHTWQHNLLLASKAVVNWQGDVESRRRTEREGHETDAPY